MRHIREKIVNIQLFLYNCPKNYTPEEKKLHAYLKTKISIKNTSKEKGQIVIKFKNKQTLKKILKKIYE